MAEIVSMPEAAADISEGQVVVWLKREGEAVSGGEPLLIVMLDKVEFEVVAPASGVLKRIMAQPGEKKCPGEPLALIAAAEGKELSPHQKVVAAESVSGVRPERVKASPLARKLAEELGFDISKLKGSGPEGRITKEDIMQAKEGAALKGSKLESEIAIKEIVPLSGLRGVIARRISESWRNAAMVTEVMEADVSDLLVLREANADKWEREKGARTSLNDFVIKASAFALRESPALNAAIIGDEIIIYDDVNIGIAVELEGGLVVPVIKGADKKDIFAIARESHELAAKAKNKRLKIEEMCGGTFTISNLGGFGVQFFTPIINPPQAAILGVGKAVDKLALDERGAPILKKTLYLCLSFDHRAIDGAPAARFMTSIKDRLEHPGAML